jgi:outer membrane protein assembly factor BamA
MACNLRFCLSFILVSFVVFYSGADNAVSDKKIVISEIIFHGNKVTKESILLREIQFSIGDTISQEEFSENLVKSHDNLMNTSLFNFVEMKTRQDSFSGNFINLYLKSTIDIFLTERWYTWPFPVFQIKERNFNSWMKNKSITDITYGFLLQQNNFRGRKEKLLLTLMYGYDQKVGITYEKPYINKKQTIGFVTSAFFTQNHSAKYSSFNNKMQSIRFVNDFIINDFNISTKFTYRKDFHIYHAITFKYSRLNFSDTLMVLNPDYNYKKRKHPDFFGLSYRVKLDFRDYQPYPLSGWFFDLEVEKTGVDLRGGQNPDLVNIRSSLRKYWELLPRFYFAGGVNGKYSFGQYIPYYFQKALGYDNDYVRGYEYYVIDGQDFVLFKSNLKWTLIKTRETKIPFIKTEKFSRIHFTLHSNLFLDMAYVRDNTLYNANYFANRWISGYGIGFDFVTYYDRVLRLEFSRNDKAEVGFFLNFVSPI